MLFFYRGRTDMQAEASFPTGVYQAEGLEEWMISENSEWNPMTEHEMGYVIQDVYVVDLYESN